VQGTGQRALSVLQTLSFLAADRIPVALISDLERDELSVEEREVIEHLERYSIILMNLGRLSKDGSLSEAGDNEKKNDENQGQKLPVHSVSIPEVVQAAAKKRFETGGFDNLELPSQKDSLVELRKKMTALLAKRDNLSEDVERRRALIPHAEALFGHLKKKKLTNNVETARFLRHLGIAFRDVGSPTKQLHYLSKAFKFWRTHTRDHLEDVSFYFEDFGDAHQRLFRTNEAIKAYQTAFDIAQLLENENEDKDEDEDEDEDEVQEKNSERLAAIENKLGFAFYYKGEIVAARGYHSKALSRLKDDKNRQQESAKNYVLALRNLGNCCRILGEFSESDRCLNEAIDEARQKLGEKDPLFARVTNDLGHLFLDKGEYDHAINCLELALDFRERHVVQDTLSLATTKSHLAFGFIRRGKPGDLVKAERYLKESHKIYEVEFKHDENKLARIIFYEGCLSLSQGELAEAIEKYKVALQGFRKLYGEKNPEYAMVLMELGAVYCQQQKTEKGKRKLKSAQGILEEVLYVDNSKKHPYLNKCKSLLEEYHKSSDIPKVTLENVDKKIAELQGLITNVETHNGRVTAGFAFFMAITLTWVLLRRQ